METSPTNSPDEKTPSAKPGGRDELNLAEFPTALVSDRAQPGQKTLYFEDEHGRLTVTGSDAFGLPTARDSDVIVALMYLTKRQNDFNDVKVNFTKYELIKLLKWVDVGRSYARLDMSLNRWHGVSLLYDGCWWNNRLKRYTDMKLHIIENIEIVKGNPRRKSSAGSQIELPLSSFEWNKKFIESCQADNLRQLDLDTYFDLESPVSKRLYRFLGKRFYKQADWTFDLHEVAFERVGLSRNYADAGKIKEKLQPAIDELESIGFLRPLSREKRYKQIDRGHWTIRLTRPSPGLVISQPAVEIQPAKETPPVLPPLVADLIKRGVTKKAALDLVERHPAEAIAAKIEEFDFLAVKKDSRALKSPAGYLVSSINGDYAVPNGFVSKAKLTQREEQAKLAAREAAERRILKRQQEAKEDAELRTINDFRKRLTPEELAKLESQAIAQADEVTKQTLSKAIPELRRVMLNRMSDELIRKLLQEEAEPA